MKITTVETKAAPGRKCVICTHSDRNKIEAALIAGDGITGETGVATRWSLNPSSVHRHIAKDLRPALKALIPIDPANLFETARAVAARAEAIADKAFESGDGALAIRAGDAQVRAVAAIADRFGSIELNAAETESSLAELTIVARSVGQAARRDPRVGELVAKVLADNGHEQIAADLRGTFPAPKNGIEA